MALLWRLATMVKEATPEESTIAYEIRIRGARLSPNAAVVAVNVDTKLKTAASTREYRCLP